MNYQELRFPSGRSVERARQDAKRLAREKNIPLNEALDHVCLENGGTPPWASALAELRTTGGHTHRCACCGSGDASDSNPLMTVKAEFEDGGQEHVHLRCARRNSRYGFCWCCRDEYVYLADDLNDADECEDHAGESVPDYPEEDEDSFIEYIQKNF